MSAYYANKEKRKELSALSETVFGTKSKWQYFVRTLGLTIESVEEQMLVLEGMINRQKEEQKDAKTNARPNQIRLNRAQRRRQAKLKRAQIRQWKAKLSAPAT